MIVCGLEQGFKVTRIRDILEEALEDFLSDDPAVHTILLSQDIEDRSLGIPEGIGHEELGVQRRVQARQRLGCHADRVAKELVDSPVGFCAAIREGAEQKRVGDPDIRGLPVLLYGEKLF